MGCNWSEGVERERSSHPTGYARTHGFESDWWRRAFKAGSPARGLQGRNGRRAGVLLPMENVRIAVEPRTFVASKRMSVTGPIPELRQPPVSGLRDIGANFACRPPTDVRTELKAMVAYEVDQSFPRPSTPGCLTIQELMNARRSALIVSACVVGMPCGKPL